MEVDFGSLGTQAIAMAAESPSAGGATTDSLIHSPTPVPSPVTDTASATSATTPTTPVSPSTDPAIPGQPAERTYEIEIDGKVEKLTASQIKELQASGLRQSDYTQKTQEVARKRQEAEAVMQELHQRQQQIQQLLSNPAQLLQLAQQQMQAAQPQAPVDPNQPVTIGQMQQIIGQLQQAQQGLVHEAQQLVDNKLQVAQYAETINQTITGLYNEFPVLKARPEFEDVMRYNVAKMDPKTPEEAVAAFKIVAKELNDSIEETYKSRQQAANTQRAQLAATGIEPPGGVAPQPAAPNYMRSDKRDLDWNKLAASAMGL
jgi:hypothetical protein